MVAVNLSKLSDAERLALAKQRVSDIRDSLPKELYAGSFTLESKLPWKATQLRELLLHRVSDIADVAIELYESGRAVPALILTRALVKTTAMVYRLFQKSREFMIQPDDKSYDDFLIKGLLGSKNERTKVESYNVLTAVNHLDRKFNGLRKMYDTLCEFTHPNWCGVMGSYSMIDEEQYVLYLGKNAAHLPLQFCLAPLITSLCIFVEYYDQLADLLKSINDRYEQKSVSASK
jgi:hypothetical protein